jgi:predicted nucleic acid-binding protein
MTGKNLMSKTFIDTNIVVCANDKRDSVKQKIAVDLISTLMDSGQGVISTQVLQEYAVTALQKLHQRPDAVIRTIAILEQLEVVQQNPEMIRKAVELKTLYQISFWDACIVSNAVAAGCSTIISEDLNTGQFYSGVAVINPFI